MRLDGVGGGWGCCWGRHAWDGDLVRELSQRNAMLEASVRQPVETASLHGGGLHLVGGTVERVGRRHGGVAEVLWSRAGAWEAVACCWRWGELALGRETGILQRWSLECDSGGGGGWGWGLEVCIGAAGWLCQVPDL